jgi:TipAS antibiotic-recognition domain
MEWSATLQDYELNRDVRAAIERGDPPDSPVGSALVARWRDAIARFTGGDDRLRVALARAPTTSTWIARFRCRATKAKGRA